MEGKKESCLRQSVRDSTGVRTELSTNVRGILLSHVERGGAGEASPSDCRDQHQSDQSNLSISTLKCLPAHKWLLKEG